MIGPSVLIVYITWKKMLDSKAVGSAHSARMRKRRGVINGLSVRLIRSKCVTIVSIQTHLK